MSWTLNIRCQILLSHKIWNSQNTIKKRKLIETKGMHKLTAVNNN